jgi:hypothetical protein
MNAWYSAQDMTLRVRKAVDLGIAINTDDGLFVAVMRNVHERDDADLRDGLQEMKRCVAAREIPLEDMRGATITLLRFIDFQRTTAEVLAIERLHGAGGIGIRHFDEAEAARATGFAIVHQGHLVDGAVGSKQGAHLIFGGSERQISNVKFHPDQLTIKETVTGIALSAGSQIFGSGGHRECGPFQRKNSKSVRDGTANPGAKRLFIADGSVCSAKNRPAPRPAPIPGTGRWTPEVSYI